MRRYGVGGGASAAGAVEQPAGLAGRRQWGGTEVGMWAAAAVWTAAEQWRSRCSKTAQQ